MRDHITQQMIKIRTKYIFGADGARSVVSRSLSFKYVQNPAGPKACNVLLRANLARHVSQERQAGIHWMANPENAVFLGIFAHLRVVRPWDEWVMVAFGPGETNPFEGLSIDDPKLVACVRELVGDDSLHVEILAMDPWTVRDSVAEEYSMSGSNAFVLGDVAHRHPPNFGLGSNTYVQDAYNLAWKVAFVSQGLAGHSLLDTYSQERQPIGVEVVRQSNNQLKSTMMSGEHWE